MQDTPRQLRLDVLRRQQDQNHQGKITSVDRRKGDVVAEQRERNVWRCDALCGTNKTKVLSLNSAEN